MTPSDMSILVVDDICELRTFLTSCLKQLGVLNVYQAKDGVAAVQILQKKPRDIVFLDIEMPKQNGIETLQQIHKMAPDTFVIMLSCHNSIDNVKKAISCGANGFIVKPFSGEKIEEALGHFAQYHEKLNQPQ
jgi:two-component system chemotaxis response regulator CheY